MKARLTGLVASVVIVVLLVGIPAGLVTFAGPPWPSSAPSLDGIWRALTSPDDGTAFLVALKVLGWLAWASFAAMLVLEIVARLRGVGPPRVPALGLQQRAASGLVSAAVLLFAASAAVVPTAAAASSHGAAESTVTVTSSTVVSSEHTEHDVAEAAEVDEQRAEPAAAPEASTPDSSRTYAVKAGDSLWSVAERELGDGSRWSEIAELNYGVEQPDGRALDQGHWLHPGWVLNLPVIETAPTVAPNGEVTVETGDTLSQLALEHLGDAKAYPSIFEASKDVVQPGDRQLTDPDHIEPGWTLRIPGAGEAAVGPEVSQPEPLEEAEAPPAESPGADASPGGDAEVEQRGVDQAQPIPGIPEAEPETALPEPGTEGLQAEPESSEAEAGADDSAGWPIRTAAGVGALLAALIVAVLGQRRTRQRRRRKPGDKTPLPGPAAAAVEQEIRAVADQGSVDVVDSALRGLADSCEKAGMAAPAIRIVRLRDRQVEVYLQHAAELPAPWQQVGDATVWITEIGEATAAVDLESRYPALVSVGYDAEDGLIMLNLEQLGSFGLVGDRTLAAEGAAAIAMELGASPWASRLALVVIGGLAEVAEVLPGRARYLPDFGDQLIAEVLSVPDEQATVVLAMTPLSTSQHDQLRELGAAVVSCDARHREWALEVTDRDNALLQPVGLDLQPQLVDQETYAGVVEALATSMLDPGVAAAPGAPVVPFGDNHRPHAADPPNEMNEAEPETELPELTDVEDQVDEHQVDDDAVPPPREDDESVDASAESSATVEDEHDEATAATPADEPSSTATESPDDKAQSSPDVPATAVVNPLLETGHPVVRLLAPTVDIIGAGADGPSSTTHRAVCTRVAAYLALHPDASRPAMVQGVWGGQRISAGTVDSRLSNLRKWFGTNPETAEKYLPPRQLRFADEVTTDWAVFTRLIGPSVSTASTSALEEALTLVRGRPLEGEESRHYAFVEHLLVEMYDTIADAAYELARRRYMDGAWSKAGQAAALGVHLDPGNERLWRLRIHAAHSAGRPDQVAEAIDRMHARISELGFELDEETTELLAAIEQHDQGTIEQSRDAL